MELPSLRLTVEKGPRKGEILDCKPGNVSRVGRVIRGNQLAVRDAGVSQKHLTFEFLPDASSWAVSDLDTSNGTIVNGREIPPFAPFPLSDGDIVKIGEATAISVKILAAETRNVDGGRDDEEESSRLRPRRGRPPRGAPPLPAVEETATDVANEVKILKGKGRLKKRTAAASVNPKKDDILEPEIVEESTEGEVVPVAKGRARGRTTTRSAAAKVSKKEEGMEDPRDMIAETATTESAAAASVNPKKDGILEPEILEESTEVEIVPVAKGRTRGRRTTTRSAAAKVSEKEEGMKDPRDMVAETAMTKSAAAKVSVDKDEMEDPRDSVPVAATTRPSAASKVSEDEKVMEHPHDSVPVADSKSAEAAAVAEMEDAVAGSDAAEEAAGDGGPEEPVQEEEKEVAEDMEKMTLGEWFDRIEKILPLMIHDVAQETIENLRDKAQRFDEFIATSSAAV